MRQTQIAPVSYGVNTATSSGTAIASEPTIYTASFVEVAASLPTDIVGFWYWSGHSAGYQGSVKFYAGAAGSETEFAHLAVSPVNFGQGGYIPIPLPAGTRISCKATAVGNGNTHISITPVRGQPVSQRAQRGTLLGQQAASAWLEVDCGTTANAKGAWVEILSAANNTRDSVGFTLFTISDPSIVTNAQRYIYDIAVGVGGSEQIVLADATVLGHGYRREVHTFATGPVWVPIPASTRIAVRCQTNTNTATDNKPHVLMTLWE